ncbi:CsgG/HfaB family protein [Nitratiruptor tergarcus]|uniref:Uncharacterized protein involved in formation of curli polymers n=1 Tax=Nitratiruptor tergarcus DSM 16512 TaxID=1069081 RepID=A0A1W1WR29_9BACT|nr:CsgG/HfaB family protein [Nitratiruptor tergarcus]SMC08771.1 Uncharacterized protein involved in formation of curli polymers [Nitratiruptor tergarcus DSM 16512]
MKKFIVLILFSLSLFAGIKTISVIAQGYGTTYDEAVKNALINAVGQVKGIAISARKRLQRKIHEAHISVNDSYKASIKVADRTSNSIYSSTGGFINSYKIIYVKKISPKEYKAKVKAYFAKYRSPGLNPRNRRSLAVLPFEYKKNYTLYGISINGKALSDRITQSIVNKITQTRKFTVLDRQNSKYYQVEKDLLTSGDSDPVELARLGKRLGADYFVIGQILDFGVNKNIESNYYTGESSSKNEAYATIAYRILNIPTQQIKWSDTIDIEFELPPARRAESIVVKAGDKIAQVLVEQIIFNIYPPKIVSISRDRVVVNMGGNFIHTGEKYEVYKLGKRLYDPYTKESLGREEIKIGTVKITKVLPKISYAKVVEGKVRKGAILKKISTPKEDDSNSQNVGKESMFDEMFHK